MILLALTVGLLQAACPTESAPQGTDTIAVACNPNCLFCGEECGEIDLDLNKRDDENLCEIGTEGFPEEIPLIRHQFRVAAFESVARPLDEFRDRLTQGQSGRIPVANRMLGQSEDLTLEDDVPCCVRLELDDLGLGDDIVQKEVQQRGAVGNVWFDDPTGKAELFNLTGAARGERFAVVVVRELVNERGRLIPGSAAATSGVLVVTSEAGGHVWAHEFGHLMALGHYDCNDDEFENRLMYPSGDEEFNEGDPQDVVTCAECNYFRATVEDRQTINTVAGPSTCRTVPDGGLLFPSGASTVVPTLFRRQQDGVVAGHCGNVPGTSIQQSS